MFAIEEGLKKINGETVETFCREVVETNTGLLVEAGTTGYKGGCCRDTGGRTFIGIVCECGDFHFGPVKNDDGQIIGVEMASRRRPATSITRMETTVRTQSTEAHSGPRNAAGSMRSTSAPVSADCAGTTSRISSNVNIATDICRLP